MRLIVLFIWFMLFAQSVVGKDLNDADKAKALNRQVDLLIGQLSTATDSSFAISHRWISLKLRYCVISMIVNQNKKEK